jgi:uncharacterized protein (TIGR04255 family)
VFYVSRGSDFLLQVQPSRFLCNWRKQTDTEPYPRFEVTFARFLEGWQWFLSFVKEKGLGIPAPNLYELTYVNQLFAPAEGFPQGVQHYLPVFAWKHAQSISFLPPPTGFVLALKFALPESKGALHVSAKQGIRRADEKPVVLLELTARGRARDDWSDLTSWFSTAHEWIVRGFTDLTSAEGHRVWERQR